MIFGSRVKNFLLLVVVGAIFIWILAMVGTIIFFALVFLILARIGWSVYSFFSSKEKSNLGTTLNFEELLRKESRYSQEKSKHKNRKHQDDIIDGEYEDLTDK